MAGDERRGTYFAYLNLFVAAMLVLVLGQSFRSAFLGWEGVGLCSYLLIGFWFDRPLESVEPSVDGTPVDRYEVSAAARREEGLHRQPRRRRRLPARDVPDLPAGRQPGLRPGVRRRQLRAGRGAAGGVATVTALLLFLACTGKSAQIPLFTWPSTRWPALTPASALIHAATMVTAGVFLVARTHPIFEASPGASATVTLIGAATARSPP